MKKYLILPLALLVLAVLPLSCGKGGKKKGIPSPSDKVFSVSTARVVTRSIPDTIDIKGIFTANQEVVIKSEFSGRVQALSIIAGQNVSAGDAILKLDDEKLPFVMDRQRAELREAEAQLDLDNKLSGNGGTGEDTNNDDNNPPEDNNNPADLPQNAPNPDEALNAPDVSPAAAPVPAASPSGEDTTEEPAASPSANRRNFAAFRNRNRARVLPVNRPALAAIVNPEQAESRAALDQAKIDRIKAEIALTEKQMAGTALIAPFNGFVNKVSVTEGGLVKADDILVEIIDVDPIELVLKIPKEQSDQIDKSMEGKVTVDDLHGQSFTGEISFIGVSLDPKDKTIEVRLRVANPNFKIKVGMEGNAELGIAKKTHDGMLIPSEAILSDGNKKFVYVIRGQVAEKVEIETGGMIEGLVEVRKGLKASDQIVTRGLDELKLDEEYVKINS